MPKWTTENDIEIIQLRQDGYTIPEICEKTGRTTGAIKGRFRKLEYFKKPHWTKDEDETLIRMRKEGYTYQEISDSLNRSVPAVGGRCSKLGLCKLTAFKVIQQWADNENSK